MRMMRRNGGLRSGLVGLAASMAIFPGVLGAQTPQASLTEKELSPIYAVAENLRANTPACIPAAKNVAPPAQNLASELMYEEAAAMFGVLLIKYPRAKNESPLQRDERLAQQEDILTAAINAYREAHACRPDGDGARHLRAALALVAAFERQLHEQLPPKAPQFVALESRKSALQAGLPPETKCPAAVPCPLVENAEPLPSERGYRARGMGRSFLRAELGYGGGRIEYVEYKNSVRQEVRSGIRGLALRISAGVRLLAGKRDRHVLLFGGFYAFQQIKAPEEAMLLQEDNIPAVYRMVHGGGLMFEWGIRLAGGVVSIHPGADFGVLSFLGGTTFGHLQAGGSLGLCFAEALVCATGRLQRELQATEQRTFNGGQFMLGFDIMRYVDRRVSKASG